MGTHCRFCATPVESFMDMGRMPLANNFLGPEDIDDETFFDLKLALCDQCKSFQIVDLPAADQIFRPDYPFMTSTSRVVTDHFRVLAETLIDTHFEGKHDPFVVEIGSNDGTLLKNFAECGIRHLGIEPAADIAAIASAGGINTTSRFFNAETARDVIATEGKANLILGMNVIAHIADIKSVAEGISALLDGYGVFVLENIYLGDLIANTAYDQLYDEHVFTYSVSSVNNVYSAHGLEIVDVAPVAMQGGSLRYTLARAGAIEPAPIVGEYLERERSSGLFSQAGLNAFRQRSEANRDGIRDIVLGARREGKRVAGYGAAAKSTIILNYCGLSNAEIDYVIDSTPAKQGKVTPGTHIPIVHPNRFKDDPPDLALLFAWNHIDEIRSKEPEFEARNGRWIVPMPEPAII